MCPLRKGGAKSRRMTDWSELAMPPRIRVTHLALHPVTIEKTFADCILDLSEVIVLDGIDILPDKSRFRVRSHDLHGQLPEIVIQDSGDRLVDKDRLGSETCKLVAIVRLQDQMRRWFRGGKFLPPTKVGDQAMVGFKLGRKAWVAEGEDLLAAYHALHSQVVG
jgi:hypothetical protein